MGRKSDLTIEDYRCQFCSFQLSIPPAINEKILKSGDFDKSALFCSFIFKKIAIANVTLVWFNDGLSSR